MMIGERATTNLPFKLATDSVWLTMATFVLTEEMRVLKALIKHTALMPEARYESKH
jgi:hypothetical protein